ncbi:LLM class flavin-dependent oxidoreductase [Saccharothrix sp. S26]|uniref:LLM class flavin-dependent oxidoreductase n=1 Tax=Saccharothrix sp. S26 TaxID=2907215 RepID=UPI001F18A98F|nr:LLM class flavin-dependent oxidoreductase [Saccharothrix sp. S26]MCE7000543.1 LLM class flavin-dependent oxidoreductase [Saccharothrix sp. S26]
MRLGHAAVLAPARFNHPIRAAERAAMPDHLSGGRLEFGLTAPPRRSGGCSASTRRTCGGRPSRS